MNAATACTTTIDVRELPPRERHSQVFAAFRALGLGEALDILAPHDPQPLFHQFQVEAPGNFSWSYLHSGPDVWRVRIAKLARAHGAGECCGHCGGGA